MIISPVLTSALLIDRYISRSSASVIVIVFSVVVLVCSIVPYVCLFLFTYCSSFLVYTIYFIVLFSFFQLMMDFKIRNVQIDILFLYNVVYDIPRH